MALMTNLKTEELVGGHELETFETLDSKGSRLLVLKVKDQDENIVSEFKTHVRRIFDTRVKEIVEGFASPQHATE